MPANIIRDGTGAMDKVETTALSSQNYADTMKQAVLPDQSRDWSAKATKDGLVMTLPILVVYVMLYAIYTVLCTMPCDLPQALQIIKGLMLFMFNILFWPMFISFWQCVRTDPGRVPRHWGFHIGETEARKRYCKQCCVWKPDRCYHCHVCNRCVLNMDHHSPWHNNCIGFYNRKFFIQNLVYGFFWLVHMILTIPVIGLVVAIGGGNVFVCIICMILLCPGICLICNTLTNFVRFHVRLAIDNNTTIENLERGPTRAKTPFDLGRLKNWQQVFGEPTLLWMLPFHVQASRPIGDGVCWLLPSGEITGVQGQPAHSGDNQDQCCRILVVGDTCTGKSHLVSRILFGTLFYPEPTIGLELGVQAVDMCWRPTDEVEDESHQCCLLSANGSTGTSSVQLHLWEKGGKDSYQAVNLDGAIRFDGAIIVYDITNEASFEHTSKWFSYVQEHSKQNGVFMLLGNKLDLVEKDPAARKVNIDAAEQLARQKGILFAETSAMDTKRDSASYINTLLKRLLESEKVPCNSLAS